MRALAVLAVILVHLGVSWLPGGYIGVDIFFVISGYLITSLLIREYRDSGTISLAEFYRRRVRRLFPALLVVCLLSVLAGFLLISDEHYRELLDSTLATFFSVSNIYFFSQVGYFDSAALSKPLLHTWSLGVEEQFYLVWPVCLLVLFRYFGRLGVFWGIALFGAGSFALNGAFISFGVGEYISSSSGWRSIFLDPNSTAFYLMPFRIFEFSLGALMSWVCPRVAKVKKLCADILVVSAVCGLLFLMVRLTEKSVFPYYNALMVAALSATLIAFSSKSRVAAVLLGNRLMVFLGGISYSLYLVHWPLIVFYVAIFGELTPESIVWLLCITMISGYALHVLVENRFRHAQSSGRETKAAQVIARGGLISALAIAVVIVGLLRNIDGRITEQRMTKTNFEWRSYERKLYCKGDISGFPKSIFTCQNNRGSKRTIVVWGDSHGLHLVAGLSDIYPDYNIAIAYLSACNSQSGFKGYSKKYPSQKLIDQCVDRNKSFLKWAESYRGEAVIYLSNAKRSNPQKVADINNEHVSLLESYGHSVYVMGDFIRPGSELALCYAVPDYILSDDFLRARCKVDDKVVAKELRYSERLALLSRNYIAVHKLQCPAGVCQFSDDTGRVSFRDTHHLSAFGSIYWLRKLEEEGLLNRDMGLF